ncbi:MAG: DNA gyrase subunit A, partial [Betaproteobacteria bacterium]|nr:DNA gyrase subunit A [Betaproteobacteria bacterium]
VTAACLHLLAHPDASIEDLMAFIPAPDFPTAGIIYGLSGVREGYRTGRGRVVMRARTHFEDIDKGQRQAIIVDELPYQVNKRVLLEKIAELVNDKRLEGISDIRDESDKSGMRVVIELKRNEHPEVVLNNLYKNTQLQDSFGINMVALVDGQPRLLNLKQMIEAFLSHRREVITRRTVYELRKARERGHVLEGLAVALANVDEMIETIKTSPTPPIAKERLLERTWDAGIALEMVQRAGGQREAVRPEGLAAELGLQPLDITPVGDASEDPGKVRAQYKLSEVQAQEILQMRLQRLTGLEQEKIVDEYRAVIDEIIDYLDILAKRERITDLIASEMREAAAAFSAPEKDPRRSSIEHDAIDLETEDLIQPQDMVVTLSHSGYIKSQPLSEYRAQRRGGRGKQAAGTKEDDWIDQLFIANTHDMILCFSNRGRVYWLKVWEVPQGSRNARGRPIINMFPLTEAEKITVVLPVKHFDDHHFVFMATALGTVK